MNFATVRTIFFKELRDTLRDKRTLVAMIAIPIVLYPALFLGAAQVGIVVRNRIEETPSKVAVNAGDPRVRAWIDEVPLIEITGTENPREALENRELDAIVVSDEPVSAIEANSLPIRIEYDSTEVESNEARSRIERGLDAVQKKLLASRLKEQGLPDSFMNPLKIESLNVAPAEKKTGSFLGAIVPLIMVVMLGVGAFYPAVDLTAGEKERGTFETLLSTPTSKLEIVAGKFLAVFSLSVATGLLNLGSMVATLLFQVNQIASQMEDAGAAPMLDITQIPPQTIAVIALVLIPMAFFIAAVMMTVALFARSFKDAQNLVTPFFIAIVMPASVGAIPGIKLNETTQFIPITNAALLFRDLMTGVAPIESVFIVFLCTCIYALLALVAAAWMFQREEVILSEERGIPLTINRSDFVPREEPTPGLALGLFGFVMLLIFYLGSYFQTREIYAGLVITQYLLILAPVLGILWFARINIVTALNLHAPSIGSVIGAALFGPAALVLVTQVAIWQNEILPLPKDYLEFFEQFLAGEKQLSTAMMLLIVAVSPAICEEALFRGVLVSGFRQKLSQWMTILLVGIAFGLFHLSIYRVMPTAIVGAGLAYLTVRSGSIFPAMLGHFLFNGINVLMQRGYIPESIVKPLDEASQAGGLLPLWMLGAGVAGLAIAIAAIEFGAVNRRRNPSG